MPVSINQWLDHMVDERLMPYPSLRRADIVRIIAPILPIE